MTRSAFSFVLFGCMAALIPVGIAATYHLDPVKGSVDGDGSASAPWPGLDAVVKSPLFSSLTDGDTLVLRSGNHGSVRLSGNFTEPLTIAAEPGQTPQLSRFEVDSGSNIHVRGLTISPSFGSESYSGAIVRLAERGPGSGLVIEDCFVFHAKDSESWTPDEWKAANEGILAGRHGENITVRNNYVLNTRFGITMAAPNSLCEGNIVVNFSGDGIRAIKDGITVADNLIKNGFVSEADGDPNHDDLIQSFQFNAPQEPIKNVVYRGNILIGNENSEQNLKSVPQGIGLFNGPVVEFVIENNVIQTDHWHGISVYDAVNCKIINNTLMAATEQRAKPWIRLDTKNKGGSMGNLVKDNLAESFNLKADTTVTEENNEKVDEAAFGQALKKRQEQIEEKFGAKHATSGLPRFSAN